MEKTIAGVWGRRFVPISRQRVGWVEAKNSGRRAESGLRTERHNHPVRLVIIPTTRLMIIVFKTSVSERMRSDPIGSWYSAQTFRKPKDNEESRLSVRASLSVGERMGVETRSELESMDVCGDGRHESFDRFDITLHNNSKLHTPVTSVRIAHFLCVVTATVKLSDWLYYWQGPLAVFSIAYQKCRFEAAMTATLIQSYFRQLVQTPSFSVCSFTPAPVGGTGGYWPQTWGRRPAIFEVIVIQCQISCITG